MRLGEIELRRGRSAAAPSERLGPAAQHRRLGVVARQRRRPSGTPRPRHPAAPIRSQQLGAHGVQRAEVRQLVARGRRRSSSAAAGSPAIETATARLSRTTGEGARVSSASYSAHDARPVGVVERRRDRVALGDRRLQPVVPEARGPRHPLARSAARPRAIAERSQRRRSCSPSVSGRPSGSTRAAKRDDWNSMSAMSACTSGSRGHAAPTADARAAPPHARRPAARAGRRPRPRSPR